MSPMHALLDQPETLATFLAEGGQPPFRERQIWRWVFQRRASDFQAMTDVTIFPLIETRVAVPREIDLIMVNTNNILCYHSAGQE